MIIKTRVFELYKGSYQSLPELARAMGNSVDQIYRIRKGNYKVHRQFVIGSIKAFPGHRLDELFYLISKSPTGKIHCPYLDSTARQA